jgi:hypothetical protein
VIEVAYTARIPHSVHTRGRGYPPRNLDTGICSGSGCSSTPAFFPLPLIVRELRSLQSVGKNIITSSTRKCLSSNAGGIKELTAS